MTGIFSARYLETLFNIPLVLENGESAPCGNVQPKWQASSANENVGFAYFLLFFFFFFFIVHVSVSVSVFIMLGQENVDLTRKFEDSGKQGKLCEEDHKGFWILYYIVSDGFGWCCSFFAYSHFCYGTFSKCRNVYAAAFPI